MLKQLKKNPFYMGPRMELQINQNSLKTCWFGEYFGAASTGKSAMNLWDEFQVEDIGHTYGI